MGEVEYTVAEAKEYKPVKGWYIPRDKMIAAFLWGVENEKDRKQVAEKAYSLTARIAQNKPYKRGVTKRDVVFYLIKTERIQKEKRAVEKYLGIKIKLKSIPRGQTTEEKKIEKWKEKFMKAAKKSE